VTATPRGMASYMLGPALFDSPLSRCVWEVSFLILTCGYNKGWELRATRAEGVGNGEACVRIHVDRVRPKLGDNDHFVSSKPPIRASGSAIIHLALLATLAAYKCGKPSRRVPTAALALTLVEFQSERSLGFDQSVVGASFLDHRSKQRGCAITSTGGCPVAQAPRKNFVLAIILSGWKSSEISCNL